MPHELMLHMYSLEVKVTKPYARLYSSSHCGNRSEILEIYFEMKFGNRNAKQSGTVIWEAMGGQGEYALPQRDV